MAFISAKGWRFLLEVHSLEGLLKINESSGWFSNDEDGEARKLLIDQARETGFDPVSGEFGSYDDASGLFISSKSQ